MSATLEHANFTVSDPNATATLLCDLFGWRIRWQGAAINAGHTIHVGGDDSYLALYTPANPPKSADSAAKSLEVVKGLNHLGIVVDDLDAVETRVLAAGLKPHNHDDCEPGRRFYFDDSEGVEYEVIQYD